MKPPLAGIRVIDWTIWQQGPVASAMLADLGAEVIKLEEPEKGDPGRRILSTGGTSTFRDGVNFYFETNNRHKRSLTVNLKHPDAVKIVRKLTAQSDVFLQNFRQGVAERLGLGYEELHAINPRLIYASASGYGPLGPDSGEPSFDYLGEARSGIMSAVGPRETPPTYIFGGVADQMGAIMLAYGVIAALLARERYDVGQKVDASHLGSMLALQGLNLSSMLILGSEMGRTPREAAFNPLWNHYQCADGKWICLGMLQADRYWEDLCNALGQPELIGDPRFSDMRRRTENCRELVAILDGVFKLRPRSDWLAVLRDGGDFIYTVVNSIADLQEDPQVLANEYVVDFEHPELGATKWIGMPVRLSRTPGETRERAPGLGEHTEQILTGVLGYSWEEVARLRESGVI